MSYQFNLPPFESQYPLSIALSVHPGTETTAIELSCGHKTLRNASFHFTPGQALRCIQCRDWWPGIDPEDLDLAFSHYSCL